MNGQQQVESVQALALILHHVRIGVLAHYSGGKNILTFDPQYLALPEAIRPLFTLRQRAHPGYLEQVLMSSQRLPPVLSNLLPEGALRSWLAQSLKTHVNEEFPLMAWAGANLPGALEARALAASEIPAWALTSRGELEAVQIDVGLDAQKFSLAGVQMKFSSLRKDGRFNISSQVGSDSWIIKTPSTVHRNLPENEYTAMRLAQAIGVEIPDIELVALGQLDNLPDIRLADESYAYAIRRFDRSESGRVHAEDFAQIFEIYAHDKYRGKNYEQIAAYLYEWGSEPLVDVQQMVRRLLANILLANGDAHVKNWSMIYPNKTDVRLSPAYDIVTTLAYIPRESEVALNMAREKRWSMISMQTFEYWSQRVGIPWPAIRVHLLDAIDQARTLWPDLLATLPMAEEHKAILQQHWASLSPDFRLH
ncbi:type II toxin-antitoxin system HipA family toxin [Serratia quinivorans]|uniref:type II toxin-antitoxin system HipA family toxin n=1 Tax=Serratia quinivorans TaxID=137545 RepID=UPI0021770EF2|nr:type II toxin-antitoxin system HipA family toxin [Serratia quinivorans]CAI0970223.1 Serine/threonine-protein kinase HipA [Serratia quinivorans]CAI1056792.1 Serine/threonine-protein kinase HipA [Serratia quinivorans]CAI1773765.1 Serine/threonine-protein kinase HipA [Serratia quinivorans]CAI2124239.1 Serine/threonine-protein kinase HipA [Serratia quinivorans]CAI2129197.1 Serine/threonine-protein kinase HipA [Serratia quinivorans]